jgi:hypothetical protein
MEKSMANAVKRPEENLAHKLVRQNDALFLLHKGNQQEVKEKTGINTDSNKPGFAQANLAGC